jgi:hypothetical protein
MPGGVREPERIGAAHEAEPADRARRCAGDVLERAREPRGGVRRERYSGGPGVTRDGRRPSQIAHGELGRERSRDDRGPTPARQPEHAHDRPRLGRLRSLRRDIHLNRLEEERLDRRRGSGEQAAPAPG